MLIPVIYFFDRKNKEQIEAEKTNKTEAERAKEKKILLIGGICCGLALFAGVLSAAVWCELYDSRQGGFITTLYVVLVPIFSIVLRKKVRPVMWLCVVMGGGRSVSPFA